MRKQINIVVTFALTVVLLSGCSMNSNNNDLFQYKNSYIGDASAVGSIINQLPGQHSFNGMELQTKSEPYGLILKYKNEHSSNQERKQTIIYNATILLALVHNADWITFNYEDQSFTLSRADLENWFGVSLSKYTNEKDIKTLVQSKINDNFDSLFQD